MLVMIDDVIAGRGRTKEGLSENKVPKQRTESGEIRLPLPCVSRIEICPMIEMQI